MATKHNKKSSNKKYFPKILTFIFITLLVLVGAGVIVTSMILKPYTMDGYSMTPTISNGQTFFSTRNYKNLKRGDVVVIKFPASLQITNKIGVKRIIGLPGERVVVRDNKVTVYNSSNPKGFTLEDSKYNPSNSVTTGNVDVNIANDSVFVLGDNRPQSLDSREFGILPVGSIIGLVKFVR